MEALAQEALEAPIPAPDQVLGIVQQWPILLLFLAGFGLCYWLFVVRKKEKDDPVPPGNGHADLRAFIGAKFDDLGNQVESVKEGLDELRGDFKTHSEQDRENFRELYQRAERETWTPEQRRDRVQPVEQGDWKRGRKPA